MDKKNLKISIITVCLNSEKTIERTILSVLKQEYDNKEYIIVDGGSTDNTLNIIEKYRDNINKFISEKDNGLYDAMNKGIHLSTGDMIGILNSDDIYFSSDVLSVVSKKYYETNSDLIFGSLVYFDEENLSQIVRYCLAKSFKPWQLRFGGMPPHPSSFVTRNAYSRYGLYSLSYKTGSDFELFVRYIMVEKIKFSKIDQILVGMQKGGITSSGMTSILRTSFEMNKALKENNYYTNILLIMLRLPIKYFFNKFKIYANTHEHHITT